MKLKEFLETVKTDWALVLLINNTAYTDDLASAARSQYDYVKSVAALPESCKESELERVRIALAGGDPGCDFERHMVYIITLKEGERNAG